MARPFRLALADGVSHVTARGHERQAIVRDDTDRARFLDTLAAMVDRYRVRVASARGLPDCQMAKSRPEVARV